jgi:uncharacterized membrane protein YphA (DoxX/SURF4 family)
MTYALWIVQALLALIFVLFGGMKLVLPAEMLTEGTPVPALFSRFIGVCEILGAIGLVLPGLFRMHTELTTLAAAGLTMIMVGATVITFATMGATMALFPLVVFLLVAFVAYGRWKLAPFGESARERELAPSR